MTNQIDAAAALAGITDEAGTPDSPSVSSPEESHVDVPSTEEEEVESTELKEAPTVSVSGPRKRKPSGTSSVVVFVLFPP